jgi:cell division transport system ATP-binding protein
MDLFTEINAMGLTVLMATHDLDLLKAYPNARALELDQGRLVYDSSAPVRAPVEGVVEP